MMMVASALCHSSHSVIFVLVFAGGGRQVSRSVFFTSSLQICIHCFLKNMQNIDVAHSMLF